ncbi:unnamed protein product [Heligmosomoides polygyrus]|uniref:Innexin n=1 Tax=Heligmosomoides polygyrus TaxID=6339 RepID=A0A3P7ZTG3_HELPZ|nr:unnamed protein product [Heligmosomoides polygyrus]
MKYVYTPWILCGTAFLVFAHDYVGAPIQCWAPRQWSGGWEQYAEQYCLVENTYFVRMNDSNLPAVEERENREIRYYQWVPFVLLLQVELLHSRCTTPIPEIDLPSRFIVQLCASGTWGYKLTAALLFTKMLSIAIVVGQVLFVGWFMGAGYLHGLRVVVDALSGRQWEQSGNFPRVTFCDLEVRQLGGAVHRWTLQCVLMINMFNEKIFVFLWWWFCVLLFLSLLNLIRWVIRLSFDSQRSFITAVLVLFQESADAGEFCRTMLRTDGVTIVRLIEENATIYQVRLTFEYRIKGLVVSGGKSETGTS